MRISGSVSVNQSHRAKQTSARKDASELSDSMESVRVGSTSKCRTRDALKSPCRDHSTSPAPTVPSFAPLEPSMAEAMGVSDVELRIRGLSTEELHRTLTTLEQWTPHSEAATVAFRALWLRDDLPSARRREAEQVKAWEDCVQWADEKMPDLLFAGLTSPSTMQRYITLIFMHMVSDFGAYFRGREAQADAVFARVLDDGNGYVRWAALCMFKAYKGSTDKATRRAARHMAQDPLPLLRALALAHLTAADEAFVQRRRDVEDNPHVLRALDALIANKAFDAAVLGALPDSSENNASDSNSDEECGEAEVEDKLGQIIVAITDYSGEDRRGDQSLARHFGGFSRLAYELCCGESTHDIPDLL